MSSIKLHVKTMRVSASGELPGLTGAFGSYRVRVTWTCKPCRTCVLSHRLTTGVSHPKDVDRTEAEEKVENNKDPSYWSRTQRPLLSKTLQRHNSSSRRETEMEGHTSLTSPVHNGKATGPFDDQKENPVLPIWFRYKRRYKMKSARVRDTVSMTSHEGFLLFIFTTPAPQTTQPAIH